mmetsp:Transcript_10380/g.21271  ORF Transcript_10380/g.21271 Transcript_10380/m.21271 type:complete len:119 (+) Transcript_10380:139-495(+)
MRSYTSKILGVGGESEGKKTQQSGSGSSTSSPAVKAEVSDMAKALKRRLSEKLTRASTASYRSFRAISKEGQSMELSNVPRVFATKQASIAKTQQLLNAMPKVLAEIEESYNELQQSV